MSNKKKQNHPTPEEVAKQEKQKAEIERKRKMVREQMFPYLDEHSKSVEDAKQMLQIIAITIRQAIEKPYYTKKLDELELIVGMDEKHEDFERVKGILEMFKDENVIETMKLLNDSAQAIDAWVMQKMRTTSLKDLPRELL